MQNSAVDVVTQDQFESLAEYLLKKLKQNNVDWAEQIVKRLSEIRHHKALDLNDGFDVQGTPQNARKRFDNETGLISSEKKR
jgi:ribosomal protein S13